MFVAYGMRDHLRNRKHDGMPDGLWIYRQHWLYRRNI